MPSSHTSLVGAVVAYLNARGGYAWKNQTGVLPVGGRYVHAGRRGLPDVIGVWPEDWDWGPEPHVGRIGRLIAVECKTGRGRLTADQRCVHAELEKRGALVLTIRNISDLEAALR